MSTRHISEKYKIFWVIYKYSISYFISNNWFIIIFIIWEECLVY